MTLGMWMFRLVSLVALALAVVWPGPRGCGGRRPPPVAVVWDVSSSMAERDGGLSRLATARAAWDRAEGGLRRAMDPFHFTLGNRLLALAGPAVLPEHPIDPVFDFTELSGVTRPAHGVKGILLFSDGRSVPADTDPGVPVWAVGVGRPAEEPDLAIDHVSVPRLAFVDLDTQVQVRVSRHGPGPDRAEVGLYQKDRRLAGSRGDLASGVAEAVLPFVPRRDGLTLLTVRVEAAPNEKRKANNSRVVGLDVQRNRVRVLYISGRPGPHYAFLRAQLKTDPGVELVSFVILRDLQDAWGYAQEELALIPFPEPAVLAEQLKTFDVVVLEDPAGTRVGLGTGFDGALIRRVEEGGGLLLIDNPGDPADTALRRLPWGPGLAVSGPARFKLEPVDPGHPLLSLAEEPDESRIRWAALDPLEGRGMWHASTAPGARVLLRETATGLPALVERNVGRGRVVGLANDTSWRWALGAGRQGEGPADYQRFWQNMVRWLANAPGSGPVRLSRPEGPLPAGHTWTARLRSPSWEGTRPTLWVRPPGRPRTRALLTRGARDGEWRADITPEVSGFYEISAERGPAQTDRLWLEVTAPWEEDRDVRPDFDRLKQLADKTGGAFVSLEQWNDRWLIRRTAGLPRAKAPAGQNPWAGLPALAFVVLVAEWLWRRRRGQP